LESGERPSLPWSWSVERWRLSFVSAQTVDRDFRYDAFRALGAESEIGVSVRELSNDEVSKARLERAGGGDVIIAIDGAPVRTQQDVAAAARRAAPGAVLDFRVVREKKETTLAIRTAAEAKS
jgi:S1-C subfamily serine protease